MRFNGQGVLRDVVMDLDIEDRGRTWLEDERKKISKSESRQQTSFLSHILGKEGIV